MEFVGFKLQNIQHEINDLNKFLLSNKYNSNIYDDKSKISNFRPIHIVEDKESSVAPSCLKEENKNFVIIQENKLWSDIVENETKPKDIDFENKFIELESQICKIKNYLNISKKSKFIKFEFINTIITWELQDKHNQSGIIRMIINPIYNNNDIFQNFYYNVDQNKIGIKTKDNDYLWYNIDFKLRLLRYLDYNDQQRLVYYCFVDIEQQFR